MQEQPDPPSASRSARSARFFNYLHRYKKLLQKRWWVLPLTLAVGLGIQGYRIWNAPPVYVAQGRMIVSPKIVVATGPVATEELINFLGTQKELMKSDEVREKAADRVKALKPNLRPGPVILQVTITPKTSIFNLQAAGPERDYTVAYLEACMEEYRALKQKMRGEIAEDTLAGIMGILASLDRDLKKYEQEDINFKMSNNVVFIEENERSVNKRLIEINNQLDVKKAEYAMLTLLNLEQNLSRLQKGDAASGASASDENRAQVLHNDYFKTKQELDQKNYELKRWLRDLKPQHPRIISLTREITQKEELLEIYKGLSMEDLTNRVNMFAVEIKNLEDQKKEATKNSVDASTKMATYEHIRDNRQLTQKLYDELRKTMQSIGVDKNINQESVAIHQHARLVTPPSTAIINLIIGAVFGLLAGLGILLLVERLDDRPASFTDLQDLFDEPVLGQIPLDSGGTNRKEAIQLLRPDDKRHAFLEAYRNLRSSLLYMANEGKRPRVMLVTSAIPGDGKSMTAANFAIIMALSGSRVILVDGDLRKGLLHRRFGLEPTPGLNEVLLEKLDWRQAVQPTPTPNLSLLPRGDTAQNPGEMFLSPMSLKLIKELSAEFDYVIFDTAPVMAADDVTSLAPHVEGVIFVIRAGYTSARIARAALDLLYQREVSVLGLAFNGVETNASEYYYYRYKEYYADHKSA